MRLLKSGNTADFVELSEEIRQYIALRCKGLPDDTGYKVWCKITDLLIAGKSLDSWWHLKKIIDNSVIDLRRKDKRSGRVILPYVLYASELIPKRGYPKNHIEEIKNEKEKQICLLYWQEGKKQKEIADELNLDKGYVSRIIKRHIIVLPDDTMLFDYPYRKPPGGFAVPYREREDDKD